jgi:hypothetical protein
MLRVSGGYVGRSTRTSYSPDVRRMQQCSSISRPKSPDNWQPAPWRVIRLCGRLGRGSRGCRFDPCPPFIRAANRAAWAIGVNSSFSRSPPYVCVAVCIRLSRRSRGCYLSAGLRLDSRNGASTLGGCCIHNVVPPEWPAEQAANWALSIGLFGHEHRDGANCDKKQNVHPRPLHENLLRAVAGPRPCDKLALRPRIAIPGERAPPAAINVPGSPRESAISVQMTRKKSRPLWLQQNAIGRPIGTPANGPAQLPARCSDPEALPAPCSAQVS